MTFADEPEWMKKARQAPLRTTWDSRQPPEHQKKQLPLESDSMLR